MGKGTFAELLGLPKDARGVVLACGSVALALFGIALALSGEWLGLPYLAAAVISYLFLHTRALPAAIWLGVAIAGLYAATSEPAALVGTVAGIALAMLALRTGREASVPAAASSLVEKSSLDANGPRSVDSAPAVMTLVAPPASPPVAPETEVLPVEKEAEEPASAAGVDAPEDAPVQPALRVEIIGRLRVLADGEDLTEALARKTVLQFAWLLLLMRALLGYPPMARDELGDELTPGRQINSQRSLVRRQIHRVLSELPPQLAALIKKTRHEVSFDLSAAEVDVDDLRQLGYRVAEHGGLIPRALAEEVESRLKKLPPGEVLPTFEALERAVGNKGTGTTADLVKELRDEVLRIRGDLALALAKRDIAAGDFSAVVRHLEPAVGQDPYREELVDRLITAYVRTGQTVRANQLRKRLDSAQEA